MEDFIYRMGESIMMELDCVTDIEYPRDEPSRMIIKTLDAEYAVTVQEISRKTDC